MLSGWFFIKLHSVDGNLHSYLVEDPSTNRSITFEVDKPLESDENTWVKLQMIAQCDEFLEPYQAGTKTFYKQAATCEAEHVTELKCTEQNSFVINGISHC